MSHAFRRQTGEILALVAWPAIAFGFALRFDFSPLASIFVFYGPPCFYLCLKKPAHAPKAAAFALAIGVPLMFIVDYIAHLTGAWYLYSTLPRLLGYVAIEDVLWAAAWIFFTIMFYEHFLHHRISQKLWSPNMKYIVMALVFLGAVFGLCVMNFSALLYIPYFYLAMGCVAILIPILIEAFGYPRIFLAFFGTAAYFFYFHIIYEIAGLMLRWWSFPGTQFIGHVTILGLTFPFEEFFFWIILGAFMVLSYFRLFDTAQKDGR